MKNLILVLIVCFSYNVQAQSYTEKYNNIKNRMEYFDSNRNLVGYKIWNNIKGQWETYNLKDSNRTEDLYGKYTPSVDLDMVNSALSAKQNRYDSNYAKVISHAEYLKMQIANHFKNNTDKRNRGIELWDIALNLLKSAKYDFSNTNECNELISSLTTIYYENIETIDKEFSDKDSRSRSSSFEHTANKIRSEKEKMDKPIESIMGGQYSSDEIVVYELNESESTYIEKPRKNLNSEFLFQEDHLQVLKGDMSREKIYWSYGGWDWETRSHIFYDAKRQKITFDKYFKTLTFYTDKEEIDSDYRKITRFNNLKKGTSVSIDMPTDLQGGYETQIIMEYSYNPSTKKYDLKKELLLPSLLYFEKNRYFFKRGLNKWLVANWTYSGFNNESKQHIYFDNYGQTLTFDENFKTITWFMKRNEENIFQEAIVYKELISNKSIKPQ